MLHSFLKIIIYPILILKVFWYIGVVVIVMSTAFVASLCFELPFGGIEKIVLTKLLGSKDKKSMESKPQEGDENDETNPSEKSISNGGHKPYLLRLRIPLHE